MSDYDADYYQRINAEEAGQADRLADVLMWKYAPKSVLDVGCATGLYLKPFLDKGVDGYGVDYATSAVTDAVLQVPRNRIEIVDITAQPIVRTADLAICLEVLEHIPAVHADVAIRHLAATAPLIVFSAARPGQGGIGHINCQPQEYWQALLEKQGFGRNKVDEDYLKIIMAAGYHMGWLINNLMIFNRTKAKPEKV